MKQRKLFVVLLLLVTAIALLAAGGDESAVDAQQHAPLEEAIIGVWTFPVDGYYIGFSRDGRLCYGGTEESVLGMHWCNNYTLEDGIVTETCMGGPEDRNCPLGGGTCQARVSIGEDGQLNYRIVPDRCDMLQYKVVPPRHYTFTPSPG